MPTKTEIELAVQERFDTLYTENQVLDLGKIGFEEYPYFHCALTQKGYTFLIEANSKNSPYNIDSFGPRVYKGNVRMELKILKVGNEDKECISIYCRKKVPLGIFVRLVADIIIELYEKKISKNDPWELLKERLEGWQLLFTIQENKSQIKGLIGELYVLKELIKDSSLIIDNWTGPVGATKDFMLNNCNLEIKTTAVRYGYVVRISGLFQVANQQIPDRLIFVRLEESPNGDLSIPRLTQEIKGLLTIDEVLAFEEKLSEFNSEILNSYEQYNLLEIVCFNLDDNFPKIESSSFVNGCMPSGIINISWDADLSNLQRMTFNDLLRIL
jgi:hypothetical protein